MIHGGIHRSERQRAEAIVVRRRKGRQEISIARLAVRGNKPVAANLEIFKSEAVLYLKVLERAERGEKLR
jgi:hypothetical protein